MPNRAFNAGGLCDAVRSWQERLNGRLFSPHSISNAEQAYQSSYIGLASCSNLVYTQSAYATLSDPAKRREYDSTDTFDDSLPTDCAPEDFFAVFAPAFRRNARWCVSDFCGHMR